MWGIRGSTRGKEAMMAPVVSEVFSLARVKKALNENRIVTELVADHLRVNRSRKRDLDKLNDSGFQPGTDGLRVHLHELLDKGGNCDMCCVTREEREMDVTEHPCQLRGMSSVDLLGYPPSRFRIACR